MSAVTATAIASVVAAGATAGAGIYAAHQQGNAAENAANTQAGAATKTAQIQSDAANHAADLQAASAKQALDFSRAQSQLSLDQYNQQQSRLQPYRNLGNFALGQPMQDAPVPLKLAALPGDGGLAGSIGGGVASGGGPGGRSMQAGAPQSTPGQISAPASSSQAPTGSGADAQSWFQGLTGGKPLNQDELEALSKTPAFQSAGWKLGTPNASGVISKIGAPDGSWIRVLDGDTKQSNPTTWAVQPGFGPSAGQVGPGGANGLVSLNYQGSQLAPRQITTGTPTAPQLLPFGALGVQGGR